VNEFTDWCSKAASEWGYHVEVGGLGKPLEKDAWGRDDQYGLASQVAMFTKIQDEAATRTREAKVAKILRNSALHCDHELLITHYHDSHPSAGNPLSPWKVLEKVEAEMKRSQCSRLTIQELWREDEIAIACGGRIDYLISSVENGPNNVFVLHRIQEPSWREDWQVEFVRGIQQEVDLWAEEADPLELQHSEWRNCIASTSDESAKDSPTVYEWELPDCQDTWGTGTLGASSYWGFESESVWNNLASES
jgi:small RNA 2'-O-methyltransferase